MSPSSWDLERFALVGFLDLEGRGPSSQSKQLFLKLIRLNRSVNEETGSVSDLHAYFRNEDNVNHPFTQTQLLLVTVYQMITLISEDNKRQVDMFIWK